MTISRHEPQFHPVLSALGWSLPMAEYMSWTLTQLDAPENKATCSITLADDGELVIEILDTSRNLERYVFDKQGHLVSLSHERYFAGPLFEHLKNQVLDAVRSRCLLDVQP